MAAPTGFEPVYSRASIGRLYLSATEREVEPNQGIQPCLATYEAAARSIKSGLKLEPDQGI